MESIHYSLTSLLPRQINVLQTGIPDLVSKESELEAFFNLYEELLDVIPINGLINSHQYLFASSALKLGIDINDNNIKELLEEINRLKENEVALLSAIENIQLNATNTGDTDFTNLSI